MKITIAPEYRYLKSRIENISRLFNSPEGTVVYEGRNSVRNFCLAGTPVTIKRFKRVNPAQQIAYTFFKSTKAARAYRYAAIFRERGIQTPHEIAYIEVYEHKLFTTGYFVSATCPDPPAFPALVLEKDFDKQLAREIAGAVADMHVKGIVHGDLNLGNFLFHKKTGEAHYSFTVIDTNRSKFYDSTPDKDTCIKNLSTLTHRRDLFRFMVTAYADKRGWPAGETVDKATAYLERLEARHERKQKIKKLFKRKAL